MFKKTLIAIACIVGINQCAMAQHPMLRPSLKDTCTLWLNNGDRQIYGVINRPDTFTGKHPIAIISHGFNGTHYFAFDYMNQLAEMGYMTYCFDFPCGSIHSRSDNNTMNMSILDETDDLCAIVDYFRNQPYVDTDNIVLWGESQGGLVSALAAARLKDEVCKLVMFYPALCIPDNWNERYPRLEDIPDTTTLWNIKMGRCFFEEIRDMKVFDLITEYSGPVLIVQGDADRIVSINDSRKASIKYANARLHLIRRAGHGFKPHERKEALEQVIPFLKGEKKPYR